MKEGKAGQKQKPAAKFANTKSTSGASRTKAQADRKDSPAAKSADWKKAPRCGFGSSSSGYRRTAHVARHPRQGGRVRRT